LVRLKRYLALSRFLVEQRGRANRRKLYGPFAQDHVPVVEQTEALGQDPRATYCTLVWQTSRGTVMKRPSARSRELCPNAAFMLENITGRPPRVLPYLERDLWKAFRNHRASDFAALVAFVMERGAPLMAGMIMAEVLGQQAAEYREALKQQQRHDLEKGLEFSKKSLGIGLVWRS
jgi:hypothetical protein